MLPCLQPLLFTLIRNTCLSANTRDKDAFLQGGQKADPLRAQVLGKVISASVLLPWAACIRAQTAFSLFSTFPLTNAPSAFIANDKQWRYGVGLLTQSTTQTCVQQHLLLGWWACLLLTLYHVPACSSSHDNTCFPIEPQAAVVFAHHFNASKWEWHCYRLLLNVSLYWFYVHHWKTLAGNKSLDIYLQGVGEERWVVAWDW